MRGYCQVYTGNGKGKTTAALGLALRASGAGIRVYIAQFIKGMEYSELKALRRLSEHITVEQFGKGCFIFGPPNEEDIALAQKGIARVREILRDPTYGMVILDEANVAEHLGLVDVETLLDIIKNRPDGVELVLTGRYADKRIIERADLVTEMVEIKHYYKEGISARRGIEK
ncbi:MAG: cob(I)yrinic acid a,c-diamide adenosyltransferase [Spirochaetes bacterium]|nr:cob(I)yrinic acid a,c-diamide adenosyltransferase [Spirochaetota bacterium]